MGGVEQRLEPFEDQLAALDRSDEVIFQCELPCHLGVDVGVDCEVEGAAEVRVEEHEDLRVGAVAVEDEIGRLLCDVDKPV